MGHNTEARKRCATSRRATLNSGARSIPRPASRTSRFTSGSRSPAKSQYSNNRWTSVPRSMEYRLCRNSSGVMSIPGVSFHSSSISISPVIWDNKRVTEKTRLSPTSSITTGCIRVSMASLSSLPATFWAGRTGHVLGRFRVTRNCHPGAAMIPSSEPSAKS
ncbi:MAG: hypothetical protein BWX80_04027 [Candidatus Hydrogenedentes bacterium ADurb.Bin101]|nr:MAG: hypothetical protein BWX80_04027 [Candidatus Hydrogenedentes bacterium ADurb.Bin101]